MRVAAFLGSPRPDGNTDILAGRVLTTARDAGCETECVALRRLRINACVACERCWEAGRPCIFDDDMAALYDTIARSDVLVFATPVYWYTVTTLMKTFLDRLVPLNWPQGKPMIAGKGAGLLTAYEEEGPAAAEPLLRMFDLSFQYLGVWCIGQVVVDGVGPKGAVLEKPEALDRAAALGRAIAAWHR